MKPLIIGACMCLAAAMVHDLRPAMSATIEFLGIGGGVVMVVSVFALVG